MNLIDTVNSMDINAFFVASGAVGSIAVQLILAIAPSSWSEKWSAMTSEDKRRVFILIFLVLALGDFLLKGNMDATQAGQAIVNWITGLTTSAALFAGTKNLIAKSPEKGESEIIGS
jgi:hypothetical protein